MKRLVKATCGLAAGFAIATASTQPAAAQFVAVNNYQAQQQAVAPGYAPRVASTQVYAPSTQAYALPASQAYPAPTQAYTAPAPSYAQPMQAGQPAYAASAYSYPHVAQANELPAPAETVTPATAPAATSAPMAYDGGYAEPPVQHYAPQSTSYPTMTTSAGCSTGNCGTDYATSVSSYDYGAASCDSGCYTGAPACDVTSCGYPSRPRRQWFGGLYGLYLERGGDQGKTAIAYMTDTTGFGGSGNDYYGMPSDQWLFSTDAGDSGAWGAEIRFGSTFGNDPCNCQQPFAWEVGYWAIDDDSSTASMLLPGMPSSTYPQRIYTLHNFEGLYTDRDGASMPSTYPNRPIYVDDGMPADDVLTSNDVRILGIRVRQRFQAQNLELNFWRFGTPTCAPSCGAGRLTGVLAAGQDACGYGGCDTGCDPCGASGCAGYGACAPARPPRRFFMNGLLGVRYLRIDDDFGADWQFTTTDGAGDVMPGEPTAYTGFPIDDDNVIFSDFQADNELVGFQLGGSMNWLIGCRWNLFADSNFGIYGNNVDVHKCVYGGGASGVTFYNGGQIAEVHGSDTVLSYVGELRAGVGYQVSCNCRLTAAYRFIGIGGVALGVEEFQNTNWSNAEVASHIDANSSIILHGLQTGVECKY